MELQPPGNPPGLPQPGKSRTAMPGDGCSDCPRRPLPPRLRGRLHPPASASGGEVLHRAPLGHCHMPPARQRLTGQEEVAGTLPAVFVVLPQRTSRPGRERRPGLGQQLGGCLVKADHRTLGIMRFGVEIQDILHVSHRIPRSPWECTTPSSATA